MENSSTQIFAVSRGNPELPGVNVLVNGVNFTFAVPDGREAELVLTDKEGEKIETLPLAAGERCGDVSAVLVQGFDPEEHGYYYTVEGQKVLDPCAGCIRDGICRVPVFQHADGERCPAIPVSDLMIYKLHVKGFSKKAKIPSEIRGTFAGVTALLGYIRDLGFNAIELMPVYEWQESLRIQPFSSAVEKSGERTRAVRQVNYWGYAEKNHYFAPRAAFTASGDPVGEFRSLIRSCHELGMELYMEIYFPPGTDPCTAVQVVRYWKLRYQVDGFHLIGQGVPVDAVTADPLLAGTKIMLEQFDADRIYGARIPKDRSLLLYNSEFEHNGRALLKGDEGQTARFAGNLRRNSRRFGVVNYMANVNGFTLFDTVCYNSRHNEENGEDNRDGTDFNNSWNCGMEGPTRRKAIKELRMRQVKNALMYVFLAQGVPLLYAGDEQLNSQNGNNNAYCCDSPVGWVNWKNTKDAEEIRSFVKELTLFRASHPILHMPGEMKGTDYRSYGAPDISFHDQRAWMCSFENTSRAIAVMYNGLYTHEEPAGDESLLFVAYNAWWKPFSFAIPDLPKGYRWYTLADTSHEGSVFAEGEAVPADLKSLEVCARSVVMLEGRLFIEEDKVLTEEDKVLTEEDKALTEEGREAAGTGENEEAAAIEENEEIADRE